jgi:gliding motility-associated-like protein
VPAGTHKLIAKATDNRSGVTTSTAVTITVVVPNKAPVVKITKPANNSVFTEGQPISIEATATDSDGEIAKVEFFNGNVRLGEDTSAPYTLEWANALPGKYTVTAKATDNKGATASASINVQVKEQVFEPVARAGNDISIELPENSVTLTGDGESDNGDIIRYDWVQLDGPEGADIQVGPDGEAVVTNLAEGTYRFQLTVTDAKNQKSSDIITVRVYPLPLTSVELPRIFSPNGDGINDYWEWSNTELFRGSRLVIFNRHGQKIYEVTSYDNTWDGSVDGKPLQEDAYYYVITSNQGELTGAVRIVR